MANEKNELKWRMKKTSVHAINCTLTRMQENVHEKNTLVQYTYSHNGEKYRKEAILDNTKISFWQPIKINGVIFVFQNQLKCQILW